jgi:predicted membrane-bound mannosyltransferase/DNA-binding beta-propeller fold protein YncE
MTSNPKPNAWLDRPVLPFLPQVTIYHLILALILITTALSRFILLGERVMSHDEVNHVVPAYTFFQGGGYRYDPITHGPLQFHLIALSYTLFGDNDFTARIPDALFGIAVVAFALFAFKRYLGRVGSLVAGFLFTISPYISYYSRYTRNEIYIVFWGMALLWGVLRYLEFGRKRTLLFITIITALHFTDKATSYIFTAELLIFLAIIFISRILTKPWQSQSLRNLFLIVVALTMLMGLAAFGVGYNALSNAPTSEEDEGVGVMFSEIDPNMRLLIGGLVLGLLVGIGFAAYLLIKGIGWFGIRDERSFDLLILQGTIVLPLLAALPMDLLGFNPLDYSTNGILTSAFFVVPLFILALLIGLWWNWKVWALNIGVFWSIFIIFYTTLFTQGSGFFMGLMGALGYWIAQQGVTRGTQPLYYYALVQIPIYEFLPAFGTLLAGVMAIPILRKSLKKLSQQPETENELEDLDEDLNPQPVVEEVNLVENIVIDEVNEEEAQLIAIEEPEEHPQTRIVDNEGEVRQPPVLALLLYWSVMSLVAFSFAGERMPWLTTHIAMPLILTSGWSIGKLLESFDWSVFKSHRGWLVAIVGALFLLTSFRTFAVLLGPTPPFQGRELAQLDSTSTFLLALFSMLASGVGLSYLLREWTFKQIGKFALIVFIAILSIVTIRTAFRANFILYDTAMEFLVYAHAARDPKDALAQIEEISHRLTGGKDIVVAYDSDLLYPFWWYFRDYPNKRWYAEDPTRDLRDALIILVGSGNYGKIDPVVGDDYIQYDYQRLWWPSQAYYNLSFQRVWDALTNNAMRAALWEIWFNRNYEPYATLTNTDTLTLENWQPSDSFRMYIRKDVVSQIWEYGAAPISLEPTVDPYEANTISIDADNVLYGGNGYQFDAPRDIALSQDGTIYVADSRNHRILHLDQEGQLLHSWGSFAASDYTTNVMAPPGTFNEPWGLGIGPDGSVYVADTWNNRIQKFTSEGEFVTMWGQFGAAETPYHFWGPRDIAVDDQGRVFITDTGNKRIVIFDRDGNNLAAFGGAGLGVGQFDEPVGIAVDDQGRLYIADTWNMRIQVMIPAGESLSFPTHITWDVDAWFSDSLDNKPFLAVDEVYNTYVGDPVMGRVLIFDQQGNFIQAFGGFGSGPAEIGIVGGLAIDADGSIWVADARNNRLMRFSLPMNIEEQPLDEGQIEIENPLESEINNLPTE